MIGGGGGGGSAHAGGGGAGAYYFTNGNPINATSGVTFSISIGAGGTGAAANLSGGSGGDTIIRSNSTQLYRVRGGGGGGGYGNSAGGSGGCGGGGGGYPNAGIGGSSNNALTNGTGFAGGNGINTGTYAGGGGGGIASVGANASNIPAGPSGGAALSISMNIFPTTYVVGGGGGGGVWGGGGSILAGGVGGGVGSTIVGGNGGRTTASAATAAVPNTGSGGGGGGESSGLGGAGSSGLCLIRVITPYVTNPMTSNAGSGVVFGTASSTAFTSSNSFQGILSAYDYTTGSVTIGTISNIVGTYYPSVSVPYSITIGSNAPGTSITTTIPTGLTYFTGAMVSAVSPPISAPSVGGVPAYNYINTFQGSLSTYSPTTGILTIGNFSNIIGFYTPTSVSYALTIGNLSGSFYVPNMEIATTVPSNSTVFTGEPVAVVGPPISVPEKYGYYYAAVTSNVAIQFGQSVSLEIFMIGGGGGGGWGGNAGGGGGAGAYYYTNGTPINANSGVTFSISIGAGGAGQTTNAQRGSNGGDTIIRSNGTLLQGVSGGGAGGGQLIGLNANGISGGCGGGGGSWNVNSASGGVANGNGTGFAGGAGFYSGTPTYTGGGGGGIGGVGVNATSTSGGNGGPGITVYINRPNVYTLGGGGGGGGINSGQGGVGGGGAGGNGVIGGNGVANTGSGGGGGGYPGAGGSGGSGICLLRVTTLTSNNPIAVTIGTGISFGIIGSPNTAYSYSNSLKGFVTSYNFDTGALTIGNFCNIQGFRTPSTVRYTLTLGAAAYAGFGYAPNPGGSIQTTVSSNLAYVTGTSITATGATASISGPFAITVMSNTSITFTQNVSLEIFLIAGGGGGGNLASALNTGGGGGAGAYYFTNGTPINVNSGTVFSVSIGAGGSPGVNGSDSVIYSNGAYFVGVSGGGAGASNTLNGLSGGCGGGGASSGFAGGGIGGSANGYGTGFAGGNGLGGHPNYHLAGGGGGIGSVGLDGSLNGSIKIGGNGGVGLSVSMNIFPVPFILGGGGGGGTYGTTVTGQGGSGVGGDGGGGDSSITPTSGAPNTGSGGGGGFYNPSTQTPPGSGGSGICLIKIVNSFTTAPFTVTASQANNIWVYPANAYLPTVNSFNAYVTSYNASTGAINLGNIYGLSGTFVTPTTYNLNINSNYGTMAPYIGQVPGSPISISGIYTTNIIGDYVWYTITSPTATITNTSNDYLEAYYVAVGGGGGGGRSTFITYGGGGAGGLQTNMTTGQFPALLNTQITGIPPLSPTSTYSVVLGVGGGVGLNGSNTTFTGPGVAVAAVGGGTGVIPNLNVTIGATGGCGGGGLANGTSAYQGGLGTQGYSGGNPVVLGPSTIVGGGGGGVSSAGGSSTTAANTTSVGGNGYYFNNLSFGGGGSAVGTTTVNAYGGGGPNTVAEPFSGGGGSGGDILPYAVGARGFFMIGVQYTGFSNFNAGKIATNYQGQLQITAYSNTYNPNKYVALDGNFIPALRNQYSLGAPSRGWLNVFTSNVRVSNDSFFIDGSDFALHMTSPNRMLSIVDVCDSSTSVFPGTMQSQTCIVACGVPEAGRTPLQFSSDGTAWHNLTSTASLGNGHDVAFDGTQNWVALGSGGAMTSSTGNVWTPIESYNGLLEGSYPIAGVCYSYSNSKWYAVGNDVCGRHTILKTEAYNLQSWGYAATDPSSSYFGSNAALEGYGDHAGLTIATDGGNMIVAGGYATDACDALHPGEQCSSILYTYTSNDSLWCNATSFETGGVITQPTSCLAYNSEYWLAVAENILISRDGKVWKNAASVPALTAVEWNGQYWLGSTNGSNIWTSYDGYIWKLMNPTTTGNAYALGWNGLRWFAGGYGFLPSGVATMTSLKLTDTEWKECVSYDDPTVTQLFVQVNNFANRTLLPNSPLLPPSAVIQGLAAVSTPPLDVGNYGDYYSSPSNTSNPANFWGPKFEDTNYGMGGSMNFLDSLAFSGGGAYDLSTASSNYDISTGDFTLNWWMYAPTGGQMNVLPPKGPIISFASGSTTVSDQVFTITGDAVITASGDIYSLSGDVITFPDTTTSLITVSGTVGVNAYGYTVSNTTTNTAVTDVCGNTITGPIVLDQILIPYTLSGTVGTTPSGEVTVIQQGEFSVSISGDQGLHLTIDGNTAYLNATATANEWQFCTLTRSSSSISGIQFYINGSNTYNSGVTSNILGNRNGNVCIGNINTTFNVSDSTSYLSNTLLTNFRWVTGYSDPSAALVPTTELTSISGTRLLFTMMTSTSAEVWSNEIYSDTSMALIGSGQFWSGLNPFQTMTLSWGAAHARGVFVYSGNGLPTDSSNLSIWATALSGDIYTDKRAKIGYEYDGVNWN